MTYDRDREELNHLLLTSKKVKNIKNEILKIIPELIICENCSQNHPAHIYEVLEHIFETVDKVEPNIVLKLTALFHDIGKPYKKRVIDNVEHFWGHEESSEILANLILSRLGYDDTIRHSVCTLVLYHDQKIEVSTEGVQKVIRLVGKELMPYLLQMQTADILSHSPQYAEKKIILLDSIKRIYREEFN